MIVQKINFSSGSKGYKTCTHNWYEGKSRAHKRISHTAIGDVAKQRIISVRSQLESQKFAQIGASAIKWELNKSGFDLPSDRTINRFFKREGLIKKCAYVPKVVEYPYFKEPLGVNNIYQADIVGP